MMVSMVVLMSVLLLQVTGRISDVMASMVVPGGTDAARRRTDLRLLVSMVAVMSMLLRTAPDGSPTEGQRGRADVGASLLVTGRLSDVMVRMVVLTSCICCTSSDGFCPACRLYNSPKREDVKLHVPVIQLTQREDVKLHSGQQR